MHSEMMRAWVEIDLGALRRNGARVAAHAGAPILPMIKADAYGTGAVRAARALEPLEPWGFGIATIREAEELRDAGITRPLVCFTPLRDVDLDGAQRADVTPALGDARAIARWSETRRPWHLAIDTGMSRAGVPWREVESLHDLLRASPPQGVFTHYHSAETPDGSREEQDRRFQAALDALPVSVAVLHSANSAGAARRSPSTRSIVRPGIFLYGVGSGAGAGIEPEPVVAMRGRVVDLRTVPAGDTVSYNATWRAEGTRRVATIPIGYADGYRRALSNRGVGLLHGREVPVVGRVTMDMTMLDVTDVRCALGDVITLIGEDGGATLTVEAVAERGDLSPYELLTGLRQRLPRIYRTEDEG